MGRYYLTTQSRRPYPNIGLIGRFLNGPKPPLVGAGSSYCTPYGMGGDGSTGGLILYSYGTTFPGTIIDTPYGWSPTAFSTTNLLAVGQRQGGTTASPTSINTPARSTSCWVMFTSISPTYTQFIGTRENKTAVFTHLMKSTGKAAAYVQTVSGSVNYDGTGVITCTTGVWYNFMMSYDSVGGLDSYINGVLDKHVAPNGTLHLGSSTPDPLIGNNQDGINNRALVGLISDVCYWNRKLTAQEAVQIYNAGLRGEAKIGGHYGLTRRQSIIGCNGNISGRTYEGGAPVARRVVLKSQAPNVRVIAEVDTTVVGGGLFEFNNLTPGNYSVEAVMTDNSRQALVYDWVPVTQ